MSRTRRETEMGEGGTLRNNGSTVTQHRGCKGDSGLLRLHVVQFPLRLQFEPQSHPGETEEG